MNGGNALGINVGTFCKLLAPALNVTQRHDRFKVVRMLLDQCFEMLLRLVGTVKAVEIGSHLDGGIAM